MADKDNAINWLPPRDSNPDMLIQSQQVTLTGTEESIAALLRIIKLDYAWLRVTVTLTPTSVPDATVGVTQDSQQNPREEQPLRLTYEDCDSVDCRAAEQFAVAYVAQVGVSKETMIDAISTLRSLVMTYDRRLADAQGSVTEQSQQLKSPLTSAEACEVLDRLEDGEALPDIVEPKLVEPISEWLKEFRTVEDGLRERIDFWRREYGAFGHLSGQTLIEMEKYAAANPATSQRQFDIEPIPDDDAIFNAMRGLSREAQACLTKTVWKDGIDLEEPNAGCKSFVGRITEPYRVRIANMLADAAVVSGQPMIVWGQQVLEAPALASSLKGAIMPSPSEAYHIPSLLGLHITRTCPRCHDRNWHTVWNHPRFREAARCSSCGHIFSVRLRKSEKGKE